MADEESKSDERLSWLEARVRSAYKHLKGDKFDKAWNDPDNQERILQFLDTADIRVLVFATDTVTASHAMPKRVPKGSKIVYFLKATAGSVDKEPGRTVTFHDMSADPLEHLEKIVREVYLPLLTNPANQAGWGEVASRDVLDRLHAFLAAVAITAGHTRGETALPLPPIDSSGDGLDEEGGGEGGGRATSSSSGGSGGGASGGVGASGGEGSSSLHLSLKDRVHLLEGAVITWTKQIKAVLRLDPEATLKSGEHPTPDVELDFWRDKATQLNAIFEQLQSERVRRVLQFLDAARSTYCAPFALLCKDVFAARAEANDNVKFLHTLEKWVHELNQAHDFQKLDEKFRPILHILLLIWKNSRFYNTPARLVVIVREICNAIIHAAHNYVPGREVFDAIASGDEAEAISKLRDALRVCGSFKDAYAEYKGTANAECPTNPWRIQGNALFLRLDSYIERCHDVLEMAEIVQKFKKLEKVVIGGTKGAAFTRQVDSVRADFEQAVERFQSVKYDVLSVEEAAFDDDYYAFRSSIKELEQRLGSVLAQAFEDQVTVTGRFKILESFDALLERPTIQDELERRHIALVQQYGADLKRVQELFLTERDDPPVPRNMPPISGALTWCRGLRERISVPMAKIRELGRAVMEREEAKEVTKIYATVVASLDDFEQARIEEWAADLESSSEAKLRQPLLVRGAIGREGEMGGDEVEKHMLSVNFDPGLVRLLREVRYFLLLGLDVPPAALSVYKSAKTFRKQTTALDMITQQYNHMISEMLPVEAPLMKQQVQKIDSTLQNGLRDLDWRSSGIDPFIAEVSEQVSAAYRTEFDLKRNLDDIARILEAWSAEPLLQRKPKPMTVPEFDTMYKTMRTARYATIKSEGVEIDKKLKESHSIMSVSKTHPHWVAYVDFVNGIVVQGLAKLVKVSMKHLAQQLDNDYVGKHQLQPMIVLTLDLPDVDGGGSDDDEEEDGEEAKSEDGEDGEDGEGGRKGGVIVTLGPGPRFDPEVIEEVPPGVSTIYSLVDGWVASFYEAAAQVKRLDDSDGRYTREMREDLHVQALRAVIHERLSRTTDDCLALRKEYDVFSWLWEMDMRESFAKFLAEAVRTVPAYKALEDFGDPEAADAKKALKEAGLLKGGSGDGEDGEGGGAPGSPTKDGDGDDDVAEGSDLAAGEAAAAMAPITLPDLDKFDTEIARFASLQEEVERMQTPVNLGWVRVDAEPIKLAISNLLAKWSATFTEWLEDWIVEQLRDLREFLEVVKHGLEEEVPEPEDVGEQSAIAEALGETKRSDVGQEELRRVMGHIRNVQRQIYCRKALFAPLKRTMALLKHHRAVVDDLYVNAEEKEKVRVVDFLEEVPIQWDDTKARTFAKQESIFPMQTRETVYVKEQIETFFDAVRAFRNEFRKRAPFAFDGTPDEAYGQLDSYLERLETFETGAAELNKLEALFELPVSRYNEFTDTRKELRLLKTLWDLKSSVISTFNSWEQLSWATVDTGDLEDSNRKLGQYLNNLGKKDQIVKAWGVFRDIASRIENMNSTLPLINQLHSEFMRTRHWARIGEICSVKGLDPTDPNFNLEAVFAMNLHEHREDVEEVVEEAEKQAKIEKKLQKIEDNWRAMEINFVQHKDTEVMLIKPSEELLELLEGDQAELGTVKGMGKFAEFFNSSVERWDLNLQETDEVLRVWSSVTKSWADLEVIFMESEDIQMSLPEDTKRFAEIDARFKELMKGAVETPNAIDSCIQEGRKELLKELQAGLELCQKSLKEYLDMKKKKFPRFYFMSSDALLTTLSNGSNPPKIVPFLGDCFDSLSHLDFLPAEGESGIPNVATRMRAKDGEEIDFYKHFVISGPVENWLNDLNKMQQDTLRAILTEAQETAVNWEVEAETPRHLWLDQYPAQVCATASQIFWTEETQRSLEEFEGGQEDAVKRYLELCNKRLDDLIARVLGKLPKALRTKIITIITLDVHARDVVNSLMETKADGPSSFQWQQQLRFYWDAAERDVLISITDYKTMYSYEWIGNTGRLVITPLTDRCYITLTMALRLMLGGAPAGPAGTGKTETTKDLARALARPCYVFNCSDQMNFQGLADIFKGLAQVGAWGCFDEFNRISIEVLSVVATQVKSILDAIKLFSEPARRPEEYQDAPAGAPPVVVGEFEVSGDPITLIPTVGLFITMNPGYAGRTELPENLKALFRSCAMIRPDLALICENMLMSEGFKNARPLSIKMVTLFMLSSELLSPQAHYDWGLRAVKSVLRVAGSLKRATPDVVEDAVLMRAVRDFNTPKMPTADLPIFRRLVQDLFPAHYTLPPTYNQVVEKGAQLACKAVGLQPDPDFVKKVVQFQELLDVRHSVMLLGQAGSGKTTVWKMLARHHNLEDGPEGKDGVRYKLAEPKKKSTCIYDVVNPKAVTGNELYGYMTLAKDWIDGCLSMIMRGMSRNTRDMGYSPQQTYKWVVLDGDIDAVWIESMNTVMDDNKVLTLVSNERVPLTDAMRMIFEIDSLANATPATVSRAGILYINETDVGWQPYVDSWVHRRKRDSERAHLPAFFEKYIEPLLVVFRKEYATCTPIVPINAVISVCRLLDVFLTELPESAGPDVLEYAFVSAVVWAFGGPLIVEKQAGPRGEHRKNFHNFLSDLAGASIKFPKTIEEDQGGEMVVVDEDPLCFDFFFDVASSEFRPWRHRVERFVPHAIGNGPDEVPFGSLVVPTVDSVRLSWLTDKLVRAGHPVMLCGTAGTGKTTVLKTYLREQLPDNFHSKTINMNYYMDSLSLQAQLDAAMDKRSGKVFGPPSGQKLVYLIDDLNLPYKETYGTQNALELLRQTIDHRQYYDREDLSLRKEIVDCQFLAAMNPTYGSFTVAPRLQRFFTVFATLMPSASDLKLVYESILTGHLKHFNSAVRDMAPAITDACIEVLQKVQEHFLPSAKTFTYNWNMRELSNAFRGVTNGRSEFFPTPTKLLRLVTHELYRVFQDRMVDDKDKTGFDKVIHDTFLAKFKDVTNEEELFAEPLIFTDFAAQPGGDARVYIPVPDGDRGVDMLSSTLVDELRSYNEQNSVMELVLFEQAMEHVCRIARIITAPGGHAMLVGDGGSGKQSLSRLAAFICKYDTVQLSIDSSFKIVDLEEALKVLYINAAKGEVGEGGQMFLLTDAQIVNDRFLVYVNEMLTSGWIPDLFEPEEIDGIVGSIRNKAKAAGVPDTPEDMFDFLLTTIRRNLHLVLCFSPTGDSFRIRARRFPGIINQTSIDVFMPWPRDALVSVADRFLSKLDLESDEIRSSIAEHMAECHLTVTDASEEFKRLQRRYNYVTPKSFLELIAFYTHLLNEKRELSGKNIKRLDDGLSKLLQTATDVAELQEDLERRMVKVKEKVEATAELLAEIDVERADAREQEEAATKVADVAAEEEAKALKIKAEADEELAEAKPAMEAAFAALDTLNKSNISELKALPKPPDGVDKVTDCVAEMVFDTPKKKLSWNFAKSMMKEPDKFLDECREFGNNGAKAMSEEKHAALMRDYIALEVFDFDIIQNKSKAAASLCAFCANCIRFNAIYRRVKPLMDAAEEAEADMNAAIAEKEKALSAVAAVKARVAKLEELLAEKTKEKEEVEADAEKCQSKLDLAQRLVKGLSSEKERWSIEVDRLKTSERMLMGDVLVAAAFVSYAGGFDYIFRNKLWRDTWLPDLRGRGVPMSEDVDPLDLLVDDAKVAKMESEGLPADRISRENGAVIVSSKRWPLIIDPQLQGIKWLRKREEENNLNVFQLNKKGWVGTLANCLSNGWVCIIENIGEELDATLDPVLARAFIRKGRTLYLKLGGEEVEYDPKFRLYLTTKLTNPHYKPEIQAQATLVNFLATEEGLKDQLLAHTVRKEKPDLEERKQELVRKFNEYKMRLIDLEDDLLTRLAEAPDDILSDKDLIVGVENTKEAAEEIKNAVEEGKATEIEIAKAREVYIPVAEEGAMLYFMILELANIVHMYQYSLDQFMLFFFKAIREAPTHKKVEARVAALRSTLRLVVYTWVSRGLFESHKLVLLSQLTFQLMARGKLEEEMDPVLFKFLITPERKTGETCPPDVASWLPIAEWNTVQALASLEGGEFAKLPSDLEEAWGRFREWFNHVTPETEKLPLEWNQLEKEPFKKLVVLRALRPDRLTVALTNFVSRVLPDGSHFTDCDSTLSALEVLEQTYLDSLPTTPIYFILSPGADIVSNLDQLAQMHGMEKGVTYHNVSMGQGQDRTAENRLSAAHKQGHWVILNNVHLMPRWLVKLEKMLDEFALDNGGKGSHENFRLYLTSDPANTIPVGILNRSIKLTNEPPTGLKANLKRAFCSFKPEYINEIDSKQRAILFGLTYFHAIVVERKRFGAKGYNMMYPFSLGDLRDASICLSNYMENASSKIPWEDLRYIFGQIIHGGHIVNAFDRIMVLAYLDHFLRDELLDEMELFPFNKDEGESFISPSPTTYDRYLEHIDENLKGDTPIAFGLHPNAEIGYRLDQSAMLFSLLQELQPRGGGAVDGARDPREEAHELLKDLQTEIAEADFDVEEIGSGIDDAGGRGPFQNVLLLELEQMMVLATEILRSLEELELGFTGRLTMSDAMDELADALILKRVPASWAARAWPSMRSLTDWRADLRARIAQLKEWVSNPTEILRSTWLAGLINPQSFLTAICQQTAQRDGHELDRLVVQTEVTKKDIEEIDQPSRDGVYIHGLYVQGARWDVSAGHLDKSLPREMNSALPVINCRAVLAEKAETKGIFSCPIYKTNQRGPTYVAKAQLKTKSPPARWILAGVAIILDVGA